MFWFPFFFPICREFLCIVEDHALRWGLNLKVLSKIPLVILFSVLRCSPKRPIKSAPTSTSSTDHSTVKARFGDCPNPTRAFAFVSLSEELRSWFCIGNLNHSGTWLHGAGKKLNDYESLNIIDTLAGEISVDMDQTEVATEILLRRWEIHGDRNEQRLHPCDFNIWIPWAKVECHNLQLGHWCIFILHTYIILYLLYVSYCFFSLCFASDVLVSVLKSDVSRQKSLCSTLLIHIFKPGWNTDWNLRTIWSDPQHVANSCSMMQYVATWKCDA